MLKQNIHLHNILTRRYWVITSNIYQHWRLDVLRCGMWVNNRKWFMFHLLPLLHVVIYVQHIWLGFVFSLPQFISCNTLQPLLFTAYPTVTLTKNSNQTDVDIGYDNKLICTAYDTKKITLNKPLKLKNSLNCNVISWSQWLCCLRCWPVVLLFCLIT